MRSYAKAMKPFSTLIMFANVIVCNNDKRTVSNRRNTFFNFDMDIFWSRKSAPEIQHRNHELNFVPIFVAFTFNFKIYFGFLNDYAFFFYWKVNNFVSILIGEAKNASFALKMAERSEAKAIKFQDLIFLTRSFASHSHF